MTGFDRWLSSVGWFCLSSSTSASLSLSPTAGGSLAFSASTSTTKTTLRLSGESEAGGGGGCDASHEKVCAWVCTIARWLCCTTHHEPLASHQNLGEIHRHHLRTKKISSKHIFFGYKGVHVQEEWVAGGMERKSYIPTYKFSSSCRLMVSSRQILLECFLVCFSWSMTCCPPLQPLVHAAATGLLLLLSPLLRPGATAVLAGSE